MKPLFLEIKMREQQQCTASSGSTAAVASVATRNDNYITAICVLVEAIQPNADGQLHNEYLRIFTEKAVFNLERQLPNCATVSERETISSAKIDSLHKF